MSSPGLDGATDELRQQLARVAAFARRTLRFWRTTAVVVAVGALACAAVMVFRKPSYRSETVILYTEGIRLSNDDERPSTIRGVTLRLKETLMSRTALDTVAREFSLYPEVRRKLGPIDVVEELRSHIEFRAPGGDTFNIAFTGSSPEEAARVTHRLATLVIGQDADLRRKQALVARDFLQAERRTAETELRRREEALASFMAQHPRFAFDPVPFSTGAAIRASLGAAVPAEPAVPGRDPRGFSTARRLVQAPGTASVPAAPGGAAGDTGPELARASAEVARATAAVAAARANLRDVTARFTTAHPDVRAAQAEVERESLRMAAAETARAAAERGARSALRMPTPQAPAIVTPRARPARPPSAAPPSVAPAAPGAPSAAAPDVVALETDWVKLTRGVTEARQQQDQIEAALFKANLAASSESGGNGGQLEILDPAFVPRTPTPPGRVTIVAIFAAVTALLGLLAAVVRTILDDRIHDAGDLTGLPELLAEVPRV